jgi:hypothetical protein
MVKAHDGHQGRKATVGNRHTVEGSTIRIEIESGLAARRQVLYNAGELRRNLGRLRRQ